MPKGNELATAWVRLVPSMEGATSQIVKELGGVDTKKVGSNVGAKFAANIGSGVKSAATAAVAGGAAALGTALVKGIGRLSALDGANNKLLGLGHSADSVKQIMGDALASVKGTAFGMDSAATVAASAVAAGIKPGNDLQRTLKLVSDAATIAGTDMGSMGAIFNKVAASNKVQMDVINQLHDAGVPALAALADHMGVTAEEASKMASKGEIDFETFQAAMEKSLGGAAASSGNTFSGAMANVGAALGRVGAGILGGVFPRLAPLFQAVTKALGPLEDRAAGLGEVIGAKLAPVFDWLERALSGGLGQMKIAPSILAPLTGAFLALGSSGLAPLLGMVPGLGGLASKLAFLGGPVGIAVAAFAGLVAVSPELQAALGTLLGAVGSAASTLAPTVAEVAQVLSVALVGAIQVATPIIAGIVEVFAGVITWAAETDGVLQGLAIAVGVAGGAWLTYKGITAAISFAGLITGLYQKAAAFAVATAAKVKDKAVTVALMGMYAKDFVVGLAQTVAGLAKQTAAWAVNTGAKIANKAVDLGSSLLMYLQLGGLLLADLAKQTAAWVVNTASKAANTAAMVAARVAMLAGAAAMGIATAAQWALNVALNANPIALIVLAIAALVGALIWFFTQTDLGREIWANFTRFLGEAWENVVAWVTGVWEGFSAWIVSALDGLSAWWSGLWSGIGSFFTGLWEGMVALVVGIFTGYYSWLFGIGAQILSWWNGLWGSVGSFLADTWRNATALVTAIFQGYVSWLMGIGASVASWWSGLWSGISSFFSGLWSGIVSFATNAFQGYVNWLRGVGDGIASWWNGLWSGVGNFFRGFWDGMVGAVRSAGQAFGNVFTAIRDSVSNAFSGLVGIVKAPINGIIGLVNRAIGGLNALKVNIPDWVPGVGGSSFGVNIPRIPMLADGATVLPRSGGTMAILAEAGRPESVVDTGLMNRALEEGLAGDGGGSGLTVMGPLVQVDEMVVDSDDRVEDVAKALYERGERAARAQGKVNLDGAVVDE